MRKAISKKIRFEVFKRDKFTCQYCGQKAPDVVLVIEHVIPISKGGDDEILNLVAACDSCNNGKGARQLSDDSVVTKQRAQLDVLAEKREQIRMMLAWRNELRAIETECLKMCVAEIQTLSSYTLNEHGEAKLAALIAKFGVVDCIDAIRRSFAKYFQRYKGEEQTRESFELAFQKVGGILYVTERQKSDPLLPTLYKMRAALMRRTDGEPWIIMQTLRALFNSGYSEEEIWPVIADARWWSQFDRDADEMIREARQRRG